MLGVTWLCQSAAVPAPSPGMGARPEVGGLVLVRLLLVALPSDGCGAPSCCLGNKGGYGEPGWGDHHGNLEAAKVTMDTATSSGWVGSDPSCRTDPLSRWGNPLAT